MKTHENPVNIFMVYSQDFSKVFHGLFMAKLPPVFHGFYAMKKA